MHSAHDVRYRRSRLGERYSIQHARPIRQADQLAMWQEVLPAGARLANMKMQYGTAILKHIWYYPQRSSLLFRFFFFLFLVYHGQQRAGALLAQACTPAHMKNLLKMKMQIITTQKVKQKCFKLYDRTHTQCLFC